jgi:PAS domain-containing protein
MPDRSVKYVHLTAHPNRDVHGQLEYVGAAQDVTEFKIVEEALRQSEERVHLIVDSIDGLVMTATPKGEIESVNKQVLDYFGRNLEELKDWRTNDAIHPEDLPGALALWTHSVETGRRKRSGWQKHYSRTS